MDYNLTEKEKKAKEYVCLALDIDDESEILKIVSELWDLVGFFKFNSAFTKYGPSLVKKVLDKGGKVFLDLKFHDIPNTASNYADICVQHGVDIFNVHALGGFEMMNKTAVAVKSASAKLGVPQPKVIGVTILTSIDQETMNNDLGMVGKVSDQVLRLAKLAAKSGLDGIVCSAADLAVIKDQLPDDFYYITPGIRPVGASHDDQKRVMTPSNAVKEGSSLLVIGRAILKADDRRKATYEILQDIAGVL